MTVEESIKVLLIGSGGREHALAWKLARSSRLSELYAIPGSDAIGLLAERAGIRPTDFPAVVEFCRQNGVGLVAVGPEDPLAAGLADALAEAGIPVFGPKRAAARLESSKSFAKEFMRRHGIPTAKSQTFTDLDAAKKEAASFGFPVVVKADGLAAGKGVCICPDQETVDQALEALMRRGELGGAGRTVVIEEHLEGRETTYMGFCDGKDFLPLPPSSDHKRLLDGDQGPNTGGMGVFAPTPEMDEAMRKRVHKEIVDRVLAGLAADGMDYCGVLYCGLILTASGPKVLEFNVRFGDPETQAVMPLLEDDLLELMEATVERRLQGKRLAWRGASVCLVLASEGYPAKPVTGRFITGLTAPAQAVVFHAGTEREGASWKTSGGRVLGVTGVGADVAQARDKAYAAAQAISFDGMQMRSDIAAWAARTVENPL